jgi:hypothetical protein
MGKFLTSMGRALTNAPGTSLGGAGAGRLWLRVSFPAGLGTFEEDNLTAAVTSPFKPAALAGMGLAKANDSKADMRMHTENLNCMFDYDSGYNY